MAKNTTAKNTPISIQTISQIRGQEDFVEFLRTELEWPIPLHVDQLEDVSIPHDLQRDFGFSQAEDRIQVSRLLNLNEDQPWGIFLFEFKTRRPYLSHLRQLLRKLSSRRTLQRGDPIWDRNDLLFICTQDWKEYQFVHFSGERPESAVISSFGWKGPDDRFLHTLCKHNLPRLRMPDPAPDGSISADDWRSQWRDAFNIKPVTDEFYATLKEVFHAVESGITGLQGEDRRAFTELMINRLIFLKFVEKKSWLNNDRDYLFHHFQKFGGERYWKDFLYHLFFEGLNTDPAQRPAEASRVLGDVPYLNAELFSLSEQWNDSQVEVEGRSLDLLFDKLLNPYNFTVAETSPLEVEVAFNQDLLGYAYEELIADQHGQGAYYTHPTEVNLMCRESLRAFLEERCPQVEKEQIARLVYGELSVDAGETALTPAHAVDLYTALHDVTICDPAIGSGTFPVAMVKHLFTCLRSLGQILKEYAPFRELIDQAALTDWRKGYELKLHIIERSIYGCDIDYFAVQIAKLRFWIELMVECDQPVPLPNFDFKLLLGDALASGLGLDSSGTPITLEEIWGHPTKPRGQINLSVELAKKFANKKKEYYNVQDPQERKRLRRELLQDREQLIIQALQFSRPARQRTDKHILWQIDFAEIFSEASKGFDVLIANPPYLRQELIDGVFTAFGLIETKKVLREQYAKLYLPKVSGMADLYVYFFIRGFMLLKQKSGVFCFICSNSWLDVSYGAELREIVLNNCRVRFILDNQSERSFENAAVNTTINLFVMDQGLEKKASFIAAYEALSSLEVSESFRTYLSNGDNVQNDSFQVISVPNKSPKIKTEKWGAYYLKSSKIFHQIFEGYGQYFVPLNSIAKVRRGITTGCNEFFYLSESQMDEWQIEPEFISPICRGPRDIQSSLVVPSTLPYKIFCCHEPISSLKGTNALRYIHSGEAQGYHKRPTVANRTRWYDIGERITSELCVNHRIHDRMRCYSNSNHQIIGDNFHELHNINQLQTALLFISLNSSIAHLWIQSLGRVNFGDGLLEFKGYEIETIPVLRQTVALGDEIQPFYYSLLKENNIKNIVEQCDNFISTIIQISSEESAAIVKEAGRLVSNRLSKASSFSGEKA